MKVLEVKISDPKDSAAIAREVGEAVAKAIAEVNGKQEERPEELRTDVDDADNDALEAIIHTPEYEAFYKELTAKILDLDEFVERNRKAYNCSCVVAATTISGKFKNGGGVTMVGRGDSIRYSVERILDNEDLSGMISSIQCIRQSAAQLKELKKIAGKQEDRESGNENEATEK